VETILPAVVAEIAMLILVNIAGFNMTIHIFSMAKRVEEPIMYN